MDSIQPPHEFLVPDHGKAGLLWFLKYGIYTNGNSLQYSMFVNGVLTVSFGLSMVMHLYQGTRSRCWGFLGMMVLGTAGEMTGHFIRFMDKYNTSLVSLVSLSAAPAILAGGIVVILRHKIASPKSNTHSHGTKNFTWLFAISAVFTILIQSNPNFSDASTGQLLVGGISQFTMLVLLCLMLGSFSHIIKQENTKSNSVSSRRVLVPLVIASAAIFICSIYRFSSAAIGSSFPMLQSETVSVNLDSCMCLAASIVFNFYHPGVWIKRQSLKPHPFLSIEKSPV